MAELTFTQRSDGRYEATLPSTEGTLQVKLPDMGVISVNASIDSMDAVGVEHYTGYNMLRKVSIPEACTVKVVSSKEPTAANFEAE